MLIKILRQIETGEVRKKLQNPKDGFWCTRRYPIDGRIVWKEMTAQQVHNLVRALVRPMPGAWTDCTQFYGTTREPHFIIEETRLIERTYRGVPGRVAAHLRSGVVVVCKDHGILVEYCRVDGQIVAATEVLPHAGEDLT